MRHRSLAVAAVTALLAAPAAAAGPGTQTKTYVVGLETVAGACGGEGRAGGVVCFDVQAEVTSVWVRVDDEADLRVGGYVEIFSGDAAIVSHNFCEEYGELSFSPVPVSRVVVHLGGFTEQACGSFGPLQSTFSFGSTGTVTLTTS